MNPAVLCVHSKKTTSSKSGKCVNNREKVAAYLVKNGSEVPVENPILREAFPTRNPHGEHAHMLARNHSNVAESLVTPEVTQKKTGRSPYFVLGR